MATETAQTQAAPQQRRWRFSLLGLLGVTAFVAFGSAALFNASDAWARICFSATLTLLLFFGLRIVFRRGASRAFAAGFVIFGGSYMLLAHWQVYRNDGWNAFRPYGDQLITTKLTELAYLHVLTKVRTPPALPAPGFGGGGFGGGGFGGGGFGGPANGGGGGMFGGPPVADDEPSDDDASDESADDGDSSADGSATTNGSSIDMLTFAQPIRAVTFGGGGFAGPVALPFYPTQDDFLRVGHSLWALLFGFLGGLIARFLHATQRDSAN